MAEKKQELEKRLQDVTGQLGNPATARKTPKKGKYRSQTLRPPAFLSLEFPTCSVCNLLCGAIDSLFEHLGSTQKIKRSIYLSNNCKPQKGIFAFVALLD